MFQDRWMGLLSRDRADHANAEDRSVDATIATETPVTVFDFDRFALIDEVLIARGARLPRRVVLLDTHFRADLSGILGSVRRMRVEGETVVGRLTLADGIPRPDRAWSLVRDGHVADVSVGYKATRFTDIQPGDTQSVAGKTYTAGDLVLRVTTKWRLREVSLVPIGADELAKIWHE